MLKQELRKKTLNPSIASDLISCEYSKFVIYKEDCNHLAMLTLLERHSVKL